ncbi:MAG TPA: metallophosphoesterase, partial [Gaiellaceae bacterium]|nr:metallophosphoesterase [Gaiellaceae bacterium]
LHWSQTSPANDLFANAQSITGTSGSTTGSNVNATKEPGEPNHAGNAGGASIWYAWTAPASGSATVDTLTSSFDTLLGVYTGSAVGALTTIASNDDCCGGPQSKVSFNAVSGTTYEIAVDGYKGVTGSVALHWSLTGSVTNDLFANAQSITGPGGTATGSNQNATKEPGEPNHAGNAGGASVWYRWTAPSAAPVSIDTLGSSFDTLLGVYTGSAVNSLTTIASNDDCCGVYQSKVTFTPVAGTTYQIAVDGYNKAMGSVTLHWSQTSPANDLFANSQSIAGTSGTINGSNVFATKEPGEPNHAGNAGGASIWYAWTAPASGSATVDTTGSSFDTLLGVYTGSAVNALTSIASNDNNGSSQTSLVTFSAVAGTTYEIAVDGSNGASGSVTLDWSVAGSGGGDPVVVAAGDQHACDGTGDDQTAALIGPLAPTLVLPLGDESGEYGYLSEFLTCYDPTWGVFKSISRPVPGNHDYEGDSTASGYFTYWGSLAGNPGQGWYSYDVGTWHVLAINSNCGLVGGCGTGSPEVQWIKSDLAAHPNVCTLAYFHHPLYTSTPEPGYNGPVHDIFNALYKGGVDVVVNAHTRSYERFAPQDADGHVDNQYGVREFVVATGGATLDPTNNHAPNSQAWQASTLGVLKLTLHPTSYDWQFVPVAGGSYTDSGTGSCHSGAPSVHSPPPTQPPPPSPPPKPPPPSGKPPVQGPPRVER